ncbi:MAG: hypothetical protein K6B41_11620 [Butyrivibrio sp.]|nr:hypothetical protein [Butyrivibrio sp.]
MTDSKIKKLGSFILTAVCTFTLTACSSTNEYVGTYTSERDNTAELQTQLGLEEMQGTLLADYTLVLNDDKTFNFNFDVETYQEEITTLISDNIEAYIETDMLASGYTQEQIDAVKAAGDDYETVKQAYLDELLSNVSDTAEAMESSVEGSYTVSEEAIVLTKDAEVFGTLTINSDGTLTMLLDGDDAETLIFTLQEDTTEN